MPNKIAARNELEAKQAEPDFWNNQDRAKGVIAQIKVANSLLKPYEELAAATNEIQAMAELAAEDASFEAEIEPALAKAETQYEAFELQAMMSGKHDSASAVVSIKPGAGGTDACDFANILFRAYTRWAQRHDFDVPKDEIDVEPNLEAGIASVTFKIVGPYAYGYLQSEVGVHRLVRISPFGGGDTRQTSFAAVDVLPELPDDIVIDIKETDIEWQHFSTGGPGGQHQNKTQSGARCIHKNGMRAESRIHKSQLKNKDEALKQLKAKMYAVEEQKRLGETGKSYDAKGEIAFGSQIRSYVLQPYTLVREERDGIDVKTPAVNDVLDGDFDQFMHAFLRHKSAKLNKTKK